MVKFWIANEANRKRGLRESMIAAGHFKSMNTYYCTLIALSWYKLGSTPDIQREIGQAGGFYVENTPLRQEF